MHPLQGIDVGEGEAGGSQGDSEAWEAELQEMLDMHEPAQDMILYYISITCISVLIFCFLITLFVHIEICWKPNSFMLNI